MNLKSRKEKDVFIVAVDGEVDAYNSGKIREKVKELIKNGENKVVLDLAGVNYMDSAGLGVLLSSHTSLRKANGGIKLIGISDEIMDIFEFTRINEVLDIYDDLGDALSDFATYSH